jgi:hypothetical protein
MNIKEWLGTENEVDPESSNTRGQSCVDHACVVVDSLDSIKHVSYLNNINVLNYCDHQNNKNKRIMAILSCSYMPAMEGGNISSRR